MLFILCSHKIKFGRIVQNGNYFACVLVFFCFHVQHRIIWHAHGQTTMKKQSRLYQIYGSVKLLNNLFYYSLLVCTLPQRNYRFYYMFVFSATLLCLYVHAFCWVYIVRIKDFEKISIWKAMSKTIASTALIIYTFVCVWFVGGLAVFHTYLISTNQVWMPFGS